MTATLETLTVQDHLWLNLHVTKRAPQWNYAKLEQAVYYQYNYGTSTDLRGQAARYATGFVRSHPFQGGNQATAFLGVLLFLAINGCEIILPTASALDWFHRLTTTGNASLIAEAAIEPGSDDHHGVESLKNVEELGTALMARYADTVAVLAPKG